MQTRASSRLRQVLSEQEFNRVLGISARLAILFGGAVLLVAVLKIGQSILAPVGLAIVVGLVFGPIADRLESWGISPALSAGIVVLAFLLLIITGIVLFAVPMAEWGGRLPLIWQRLQSEILNWREQIETLSSLQEQIEGLLSGGSAAVRVEVTDSSQVVDLALIAPAVLGDILIFLASLYFYLATRERIRISILSIIVSRKLRWRTAHVFGNVETRVSRFLLSVTVLNIMVGIAMAGVTFAFGLPSPLLWGVLAAVLNYVPYVGQAVLMLILLVVGFATHTEILMIIGPLLCYGLINLVEGQFIFPAFVGRLMTLNPFLIFLSIIFWIWAWGPVGSLMAVPSLIILQSLAGSLVPTQEIQPRRPVRRTAGMSDKDVILENAARAIREKAQREAAERAAADVAKTHAREAPAG